MTDETNDFINLLKDINNSLRYTVFVPSLQTSFLFKQLTTKQFKTILETLNTNTAGIAFNRVFVEILKDNILETNNEIIDKLTVFDIYLIFFYTRLFCISETYNIYISPEEQEQYNLSKTEISVNLKDVLEKKDKTPFSQEIFSEDGISIICNIPLQKTETLANNYLEDMLKTEKNTENILGTLFSIEVTKAIRAVQLEEKTINFSDITLDKQKEIIEELPISLINKVIKYIELYKDAFADLFLVEIPVFDKNGESITIQKVLEYNATLFNY